MKRPAKAVPLDPEDPHSAVYLAARREWSERYGSYIAQRDSWRMMALASMGVAAVAVCGVVWIGSRSQITPYVVAVDKLGDELAVRRANVATPVSPDIIRSQLARFIFDVRSVFTDVLAQRALVTEAYAMVNQNGPAFPFLNSYFAANSPFERAKTETVAVHVESVLPYPGGKTWRVEWEETTIYRDNQPTASKHWQATIGVMIEPPTTEQQILANPSGLYVESTSWGERLTGKVAEQVVR